MNVIATNGTRPALAQTKIIQQQNQDGKYIPECNHTLCLIDGKHPYQYPEMVNQKYIR